MNARCLALGHDDDLRVEPGRLAAKCRRCGRVSTGIVIGPRRVARALPGKGRRGARAKALQRAWLAWRLAEQDGQRG